MEGRIVGGKYSLEREIARGGMGAIWLGLDPKLRRKVALKLMSPEHMASAGARGRFEREAMAIAQLRNPHVIQIYDYGVEDGAPYIVMELLEGEDLQARLSRQRRLPLATVIGIVNQAAKALGSAHSAGIIHRDLKPANIFLARVDTDEIVKILDFGVAALGGAVTGNDVHSTKAGTLVGTPHYMSPEQVRGPRNVDHRSDLWSLAVVAYRALTGTLPFASSALGELLIEICNDPVPPPSTVAADLGPEIDRFFEQALSRDPTRRFQSARELAAAFAALDAGGRPKATKILVADDEPDVALLVRQRFRQQIRSKLYDFVFAENGEHALELLRQSPDIDVILSDINMPKMNGITLLERIGEVNPIAKVIMVSAYGDIANVRKAMNRGAFDFLVKPVDFKDLEITLEKTIKHVQALRKTVRSTEENGILRMFVSSGIVDRLLPMIRAEDMMANEAAPATVAFITVRLAVRESSGFRADLGPDTIVRALNACFEIIVPEVVSRKGVVEKFVGDTAMAVFRGRDHAERALDACLVMREALREHATREGPDSPYAGGILVGVDSGSVIFGGLGSRTASRLDYTALGDVVRTAQGLAALADPWQIVISESLYPHVHEAFECDSLGQEPLPGRRDLTAIYDVSRRVGTDAPLSAAKTVIMEVDHSVDGGVSPRTTPPQTTKRVQGG